MDEEILLEQEAAEEIAEATDSGDFEPGRRRTGYGSIHRACRSFGFLLPFTFASLVRKRPETHPESHLAGNLGLLHRIFDEPGCTVL